MRILIIEDEQKVANALREGLETEHYEVAIATTARRLFLASQRSFDLLLPDGGSITSFSGRARSRRYYEPVCSNAAFRPLAISMASP